MTLFEKHLHIPLYLTKTCCLLPSCNWKPNWKCVVYMPTHWNNYSENVIKNIYIKLVLVIFVTIALVINCCNLAIYWINISDKCIFDTTGHHSIAVWRISTHRLKQKRISRTISESVLLKCKRQIPVYCCTSQ